MTTRPAVHSTRQAAGTTFNLIVDTSGVPLDFEFVGAQPRNLAPHDAFNDDGSALTTTPGTGVFGISRTAGSSFALTGETTSSDAVTDKVAWAFSLSNSYIAASPISIIVTAQTSGAGTLTAASTTLAVNLYSVVAGVETVIATTPATAQFGAVKTAYTFAVSAAAAANLSPGSFVVLEITMVVTSSSGANTGTIYGVTVNA